MQNSHYNPINFILNVYCSIIWKILYTHTHITEFVVTHFTPYKHNDKTLAVMAKRTTMIKTDNRQYGPLNNKFSYPISAAKGQLRNVESAVVNMASSYFLWYHAPRDNKHIYLQRHYTSQINKFMMSAITILHEINPKKSHLKIFVTYVDEFI